MPESVRRRRSPAIVGLVSLALGLVIAARIFAVADGDMTIFVAFGEESLAINEYAEQVLDQELFLRVGPGHDGRFFFIQGLDPFFTETATTELLERPFYRGQRMLFPTLAGGFGLIPGAALPWTMVGLNILAIALGSWAAGRLAVLYGASAWWGLAFTFNLGLLSEAAIGGSGVLAFALALWGIVQLEEQHVGQASALLAGAVLAREAMLLLVLGVAAFWWEKRRTVPTMVLAVPIGAAALWAILLRVLVDGEAAATEIQELGYPFVGLIQAFGEWLSRPSDLAIGVLVVVLGVMFTIRAVRTASMLAWGCLAFVVLSVILTRQVWLQSFDISRAVAPVFTAFVLVAFAGVGEDATDAG